MHGYPLLHILSSPIKNTKTASKKMSLNKVCVWILGDSRDGGKPQFALKINIHINFYTYV